MTEIKVRATMKTKLNMDWRKYTILGMPLAPAQSTDKRD